MTETRSPEELEADIERQRQELAHTLDELGTRLDVKKQMKARVHAPQIAAIAAVALVVVGLVVWRRR